MSDNSDSAAFSGELTIHTAADQFAVLRAISEQGVTLLDLSGVTDFDSAGLQILIAMTKSARDNGRNLILDPISDHVKAVLLCYGLSAQLQSNTPLVSDGDTRADDE